MLKTLEQTLSEADATDLSVIVKSGKRTNKLLGIEFEQLIYFPYWFVKVELKELLLKGQFSELILLFLKHKDKLLTLEELSKESHKELFSFVLWVKDEFELITKLEREYLSSEPDNDMINAGIKELDELGEFNTIDNLVKDWRGAYTHEEIKNMPYHFIFDKLRKNTIESKFTKRYQKILADKQKNKKR